MRGSFLEDIFDHSPSIILCDETLEGLIGDGWDRSNDGVGGGLGKCSGNDDVNLEGFFIG